MPDVWELRPGWQPLSVIGEGPHPDAEFKRLAATFAQIEGCSVEDVIANGPYQVRGKPSLSRGEQYAHDRVHVGASATEEAPAAPVEE